MKTKKYIYIKNNKLKKKFIDKKYNKLKRNNTVKKDKKYKKYNTLKRNKKNNTLKRIKKSNILINGGAIEKKFLGLDLKENITIPTGNNLFLKLELKNHNNDKYEPNSYHFDISDYRRDFFNVIAINRGSFNYIYESNTKDHHNDKLLRLSSHQLPSDFNLSKKKNPGEKNNNKTEEQIYAELKGNIIQKNLSDKNGICKIHEIGFMRSESGDFFLYSILEKYDRDLENFFDKNFDSMNNILKKIIILKILEGLHNLNIAQFCHNDFKFKNIMIKQNNQDKKEIKIGISDFGTCRKQDINRDENFDITKRYKSPCIFRQNQNGYFTIFNDLWALGIIIYEIFYFDNKTFMDASINDHYLTGEIDENKTDHLEDLENPNVERKRSKHRIKKMLIGSDSKQLVYCDNICKINFYQLENEIESNSDPEKKKELQNLIKLIKNCHKFIYDYDLAKSKLKLETKIKELSNEYSKNFKHTQKIKSRNKDMFIDYINLEQNKENFGKNPKCNFYIIDLINLYFQNKDFFEDIPKENKPIIFQF